MSRHVVHRLLISIPVLLGVLLIGFMLLQVVPTDPATVLAGPTASPAEVQAIRFGLGRFNTAEEVDYVIDLVVKSVRRLRELSPLWDMHKEGIDISKIEWTNAH